MDTLLNACKGSSKELVGKLSDPEHCLAAVTATLAEDPSLEDLRAILYFAPESDAGEMLLRKSKDIADLVLVTCCSKEWADAAWLLIQDDQLSYGQKVTLLIHAIPLDVKIRTCQLLLAEDVHIVESCLKLIRWAPKEELQLQAWERLLNNDPTPDHLGEVVRFGGALSEIAARKLHASNPQPRHKRILERCCAQA